MVAWAVAVAWAATLCGCMQRKPEGAAAGGPATPTPPPDPVGAAEAAKDVPLTSVFTDDFDRADLGDDWRQTAPAGAYKITDGALEVQNGLNHGLWLKRKLPADVTIDVDAWSESPDGDIKVEVLGDGHTYATEDEYVASGYVLIFGGWHNQLSVIARMAEHGTDRGEKYPPAGQPPVELGRHYHFHIERVGGHITWLIDGSPFMTYDDPSPLTGDGHDHFGFNDWQAHVFFDNLKVAPYQPSSAPQP
jgi:hypothetical protein